MLIHRTLEEEVKRMEREEIAAKLEKASRVLEKIPQEEIVKLARESREER